MNLCKKALSVLALLIFLACWCSLNVFAETAGSSGSEVTSYQTIIINNSSESSATPSSAPASSAPPKSSAPSSGSAPSSSSSPVKRTTRQASSSRASSSESIQASSDLGGTLSSSAPSSDISLPSVGSVSENNPLSSVTNNTQDTHRMNWIGVLSWACILLGVVVVLIVVLSNRRPPRGMGRKRYRRPKRSSKKRLLNDKYYRNINRY